MKSRLAKGATALIAAWLCAGASPAVATRSGVIAYAGRPLGATNVFDIYTVPAIGGTPTRLTHGSGDSFDPVFSPDGTKIAYVGCPDRCTALLGNWFDTLHGSSAIFVMNADGTGTRQIIPFRERHFVRGISWSPDGMKIAYESTIGSRLSHIWTVDADGAHAARVTGATHDDREPLWAPDGKTISFIRTDRGADTELTLDLASGAVAPFEPAPAAGLEYLTWSPDGRSVAGVDGTESLYTINVSGSYRRLVHAPGATIFEFPAWSPDGSEIAFLSCLVSSKDGNCRGTAARVESVGAGGGLPTVLLPQSQDTRGWLSWH